MVLVDVHCHILPGVDDGAKDWQTSIKLAKEAVADGDVGYDFVKKSFIFKHEINREIYNQFYPRVIAKELEEIVDYFLKRKLYKERVEPIKTLIG